MEQRSNFVHHLKWFLASTRGIKKGEEQSKATTDQSHLAPPSKKKVKERNEGQVKPTEEATRKSREFLHNLLSLGVGKLGCTSLIMMVVPATFVISILICCRFSYAFKRTMS